MLLALNLPLPQHNRAVGICASKERCIDMPCGGGNARPKIGKYENRISCDGRLTRTIIIIATTNTATAADAPMSIASQLQHRLRRLVHRPLNRRSRRPHRKKLHNRRAAAARCEPQPCAVRSNSRLDSIQKTFGAPVSQQLGSVTWEGNTDRLKQSAKRAEGGTHGMATVILMPVEPAMKRATAIE